MTPPPLSAIASTGRALRAVGWGVALIALLLRAMLGVEPFPSWDIDPMRVVTPSIGLTPAWSMVLDVAVIAAAGIVLIGEAVLARPINLIWNALALAGVAGVALHAFLFGADSPEDARVGSTWIAAILAGLAGMHAARDARVRRVTIAALTAFVMMLLAKGVIQVAFEHRITVAQYRANPNAFLASQGWTADSAAARNFERRLTQPEAIGWFGLANVYASFAAVGVVALVGWSVLAWRRARDPERPLPDGWAGMLSLAALGALAALFLAGSKGGITAAGIGLALLAGGMLLRRQREGMLAWLLTPLAGGLAAIAIVLAAIGALFLQGALGEGRGDLSLLFRWYYLRGAMTIFADHPLFGVGPAGFKDAYMVAKPPLSPEEVQSPHSVLFDYAATLGLFGLCWAALWLGWVYALGRNAAVILRDGPGPGADTAPRADHPLSPARVEGWAVLLLAAVPALASAWIERAIWTPELSIARILGLAAWVGTALAILALARNERAWAWIAAAGALVLAIHSQIEVTPVWSSSAGLAAVLIASAGTSGRTSRAAALPLRLIPGVLVALTAGAWSWAGLGRTIRWEGELRAAAREVRPLAEISHRLEAVALGQGEGPDGDSMLRIAEDVGTLLGRPAPTDPAQFDQAMNTLASRLAALATPHLERAAALFPAHVPTIEAQCHVRMAAAAAEAVLGRPETASALGEEASRIAEALVERTPTAGAYSLLGTIWASRADIERQREHLVKAVTAWERAAALDPYGLTFPLRVYRTLRIMDRQEEAQIWARRLLELDTLQRLDPLKGLTPQEREEIRRVAGSP